MGRSKSLFRRYLDFNDAYVSQMNGAGHPSDTIAALLTASELRQRSGRELITATVLAYEVYCKIGDVFDYLGRSCGRFDTCRRSTLSCWRRIRISATSFVLGLKNEAMMWRISRRNSIIKWQGCRVSASRLAESNFRYTQCSRSLLSPPGRGPQNPKR